MGFATPDNKQITGKAHFDSRLLGKMGTMNPDVFFQHTGQKPCFAGFFGIGRYFRGSVDGKMGTVLAALLTAFVSGVAMAVQGSLNSVLGKITGLWEATLIVHGIGLLVAAVLVFPLGTGNLAKAAAAPWYTWLGGAIGVLIVYAVAKSIPRVGVAPATTAIIVGQVGTACVIDHFGIFGLERLPFHWSKAVGVILLAAGAWFLLKR